MSTAYWSPEVAPNNSDCYDNSCRETDLSSPSRFSPRTIFAVRRRPLLYTLVATLLLVSGCGMGQDDMRKYALHRPSDEELENAGPRPAVAQNSAQNSGPPPQVPASNGNTATPAPPGIVGATEPAQTNSPPSIAANHPTDSPSPPSAIGAPTGISDTRSPNPSLSLRERRQISIDNMTRILQALEAYLSANGAYPGYAITSTTGQPLLSWRVALLPQLGYQALYEQFHLDEAWNSPRNQALLANIPSVYQSPERFDTNTNYLLPVGTTASFSDARANPTRRWEDGVANIAILVEADNDTAVPWTAPRDWPFDARAPGQSLGGLREDGFFVGLGGGTLALVPADTGATDLRAMFTVDGGESFQASAICQMAMADPAPSASASAAGTLPVPQVGSSNVADGRTPVAAGLASAPRNSALAPPAGRFTGAGSAATTVWTDLSRQAFTAGLDVEGAQLAMAAFLVDEPAATVQYRWIPALRRPATAIRFGVGVDYTGPQSSTVRRQLGNVENSRGRPLAKLNTVVGDLADPILERLQAFYAITPAVAAQPAGSPTGTSPTTPATMLGVGHVRTLLRAAQLNDVDVVLMFDVEEKTTRSGTRSKSVQFSVFDVWSGREVLKTAGVNYLRRKNQQNDPLYRDPIDLTAERFADFLVDDLSPETIPSEIQPEHAARRVAALAAQRRENPLALLSEMKLYRQLELISVQQLMDAYQQLLGTTAGGRIAGRNRR